MAKRKSTVKDANPSRKRKQQRKYFPQDLFMEIIARLPPKSLARFRCVNRSLYSCLTDPEFLTKLAIQETQNLDNHKIFCISLTSLYKINILENNKIMGSQFKFEHPLLRNERARPLGCCNGLLCIVYEHKEFVLLNPLTGDGRKLFRRRLLPGYDVSHGFGYDTWNDDYKIVRIEDMPGKRDDRDVVDIFLVKNNRWKTLRLHPPSRAGKAFSAMYASGVLFWRPNYNVNDRIVTFHLGDEEYGELMVPFTKGIDQCRPIDVVSVVSD